MKNSGDRSYDNNDYITIGKISRSLGIKGNVKVIPLTDFPGKFKERKHVFLFDEKKNEFFKNRITNSIEFTIEEAAVSGDQISLKFEHINDKETSDHLKNLLIQIKESERVKLPEGKYYFYDIIGCELYNKNKFIGEIKAVENFGSDDLFLVEHQGKQFYIPFRKEFIKKIDIGSKRVDAELIEGFLE